MRLVSVRYSVPVYCTVDLDAEKTPGKDWYPDDAVTRVFESTEDIHHPEIDLVVTAEEADLEDRAELPLSQEDWAKAIDIANSTVWPAWES